jgi:hypothetical protein
LNPGEEAQIDKVEVIACKDDARVWYRPFEHRGSNELYLLFANLQNADDFFRFTQMLGPLTRNAPTWGDSIPSALREAKFFRELLAHKESPKKLASFFKSKMRAKAIRYYESSGSTASLHIDESTLKVERIARIDMVPDPSTGVRLQITADYLIEALWWQLGVKLSGNVTWATCQQCGHWFETGPGTGKHVDAKFCCDEHKVRYFSLARSRRRKPSTRNKRGKT